MSETAIVTGAVSGLGQSTALSLTQYINGEVIRIDGGFTNTK